MTSSPLSNNKFKWVFLAIFTIWAGLQYYTLATLGISPISAIKDSLLSNILLAIACWLISNSLSFYQPKENNYIYVFIWCLALAGVYLSLIKIVLPTIIQNNSTYLSYLNFSLPIRYIIAFLMIGCMAMISILWYNQQEQQELERRKNEAEKLTKDAELSSLREKLQPHFLFNSLNSISALTITKPIEARKMVHQLSDFLRGTLRQSDGLTDLVSEINHLQLYLEIEKVRFGNRLNTTIEAEEKILEKTLPTMLLQPIVENAIKFGLYDTLEQVTISIKAHFETPYLVISISNPFDSATAHPNKGTGFGLVSIQRRLQLLYNRTDLLSTHHHQNQFITTIKIPQT